MQVIWEADTPDFHRRKRAARACANCQKRKKRCHHTFDHAGTIESEGVSETLPEGINSVPLTSHAADVVRFVGDMNPESILTDLSSRPKGAPRPSVLGIWLQPNEDEDQEPRGRPDERQQDSSRTPRSPIQSPNKTTPRLSALQERYLHELGAFRVLPQQTQEALVSLYFSCIDVVIPLFDDGVFLEKFRQGSASNILINAMCMVAAKIEDAVDFLRLVESDPVLSPMAFARILYVGVEAAMKANLETDRVAKIQILTLLSLHNDGPGGIEESSIHLTQAIHHAHTIGLQVLCAEQRLEAHPRLLYWTLWSLDKLNAAIAGRPVTIADRDIAIARPVLEDEPMFQVFIMFLTLSDLLAQTIAFYRPNVSQSAPGWEEDFPRFEEIVDQNIFRNLQRSHQRMCPKIFSVNITNAISQIYLRYIITPSPSSLAEQATIPLFRTSGGLPPQRRFTISLPYPTNWACFHYHLCRTHYHYRLQPPTANSVTPVHQQTVEKGKQRSPAE